MTCPLCEACEALPPTYTACELCANIRLSPALAEGCEQVQRAYLDGCAEAAAERLQEASR